MAYGWLGCAAGMAPDLDVFIQSASDPILFLEFHRHFTHALAFIPIGALVVALSLGWLAKALTKREVYIACLIGYATHGLLDACTSYGTQLFWPFSNYRVAWNNVSVIDPLFTLPMLALVITAAVKRRVLYTYIGIAWAVSYLLLGVVQYHRAMNAAELHATERGHRPLRLTAKPGFANLILWKTIYEYDGKYYIDAVRVLTDVAVCEGQHADKLDVSRDFPNLDLRSQQAQDIERFRWFSSDYLAPFGDPAGRRYVIDVRYSNVPNRINPLWGIRIDRSAAHDQHVDFWPNRRVDTEQQRALGRLLRGEGCS